MSVNDHDIENRDTTDSLIDLSEVSKYVEEKKNTKPPLADWAEAVIGWRSSTSLGLVLVKTSSSGTNVKKKRTIDRAVTDLQYGMYSNPGDDYWCNNKQLVDLKTGVKCIGEEIETYPIPPWKSNIEHGTYRYIPDNGSYRTMKFMYDDRKEWYTIRKKYPEKVSTAWHQNCKRLQRELRRQLRKEMSKAEKENQTTALNNSKGNSEPVSGSDTNRSYTGNTGIVKPITNSSAEQAAQSNPENSSQKAENNIGHVVVNTGHVTNTGYVTNKITESAQMELQQHNDGVTGIHFGLDYCVRPVVKKETRVRSTHSDGALSQFKKLNTIRERDSEPPTPMPQSSIPSGGQLLKSLSDLFIENFSSRISALDDEIKKDSKWLRKNDNEISKLHNSRAKYREHTRHNFKDNTASNVTPRMPSKTETLASDIFSVRPVAQKELKPLEKTKGFAKTSNHIHGDYPHDFPFSYNGSNNNIMKAYVPRNNYSSDMDNGTSGNKFAVDSSKQEMLDTLTGTKINTQNNKKPSKGFSTPSTITLCDNTSTSHSHGQTSDQSAEKFKQVSVQTEKKQAKREPIQNVPVLLPEISGKRMEVATVSHRLL
ncbi:uncharacterized protein LOC127844226 [Dreissena polymorpha]|uniref:Uncharacterized protein n=1 Tax=Dreissena polymorpha TaxID=45954 RepID=A0A9D4DUM5_DREPO|nr:uncharacterized protein LOC127844226 [Dreissena polymorpha]KAH3768357.1 hypothetical protein DPMN_169569 [Dreissena polymorpha]